MELTAVPRSLCGRVRVPSSKSCVLRALFCAVFADAPVFVRNVTSCGDIDAALRCLNELGAVCSPNENGILVTPVRRYNPRPRFDCGESASLLRFLLPCAASVCEAASFSGGGRLPERPLLPLLRAMESHGSTFSAGKLPFTVTRMHAGNTFVLPGDVSSQFISGLLLASPLLKEGVSVRLSAPLQSAPYIALTCDIMSSFGVTAGSVPGGFAAAPGQHYRSPGAFVSEGDWSAAAFPLCAGALGSTPVTVTGLRTDSLQPDRRILRFLEQAGAEVLCCGSDVTIRGGELHGIEADVSDSPDLAPVLASVLACARGRSRITGAARLRLKESDRLHAVCSVLSSLGADVREEPDALVFDGRETLTGGTVPSFGDHRIVMAALAASCRCRGEVTVAGAEAISKSWPDAISAFTALGGVIRV